MDLSHEGEDVETDDLLLAMRVRAKTKRKGTLLIRCQDTRGMSALSFGRHADDRIRSIGISASASCVTESSYTNSFISERVWLRIPWRSSGPLGFIRQRSNSAPSLNHRYERYNSPHWLNKAVCRHSHQLGCRTLSIASESLGQSRDVIGISPARGLGRLMID